MVPNECRRDSNFNQLGNMFEVGKKYPQLLLLLLSETLLELGRKNRRKTLQREAKKNEQKWRDGRKDTNSEEERQRRDKLELNFLEEVKKKLSYSIQTKECLVDLWRKLSFVGLWINEIYQSLYKCVLENS